MNGSRRAAANGGSPFHVGALGAAIGLAAIVGATVTTVVGAIAVSMARRVVTPAARSTDTRIVDLDTAAQTVTLARTPDTELPGRYGLFTTGSKAYVKLGPVLSSDEASVTRKLLTHVGAGEQLAPDAAFSGWYFDRPEDLHIPFRSELIGSSVGPCPAWVFPAEHETDIWVVQVHGRGSTRSEPLRAVPVFRKLGITSILVSYRNDGEAPRSRAGTYALGATEWRDVDAAIGYARRAGARRVIVMGWSMGGAVALQVELSSPHQELLVGMILESPVIDWRVVLDYQARMLHLPKQVTQLAIGALGSDWASPVTGTGQAIPFDRLDGVARAAELKRPILILHSDDDGFVPSDASHALAEARPDLVELDAFAVARHTKLWNYDQDRWTRTITDWLRRHGLTNENAAEGS
ncbi:alpha/beta hydrolase family protein [Microbacterium sp. P06]|uniref:alpha/beta hydrolase family protein n=1 Tax=unclassified Microbacterium TaxID=2609290 RepID=UPI0037452B3C